VSSLVFVGVREICRPGERFKNSARLSMTRVTPGLRELPSLRPPVAVIVGMGLLVAAG
jgi:hypothetical protein